MLWFYGVMRRRREKGHGNVKGKEATASKGKLGKQQIWKRTGGVKKGRQRFEKKKKGGSMCGGYLGTKARTSYKAETKKKKT